MPAPRANRCNQEHGKSTKLNSSKEIIALAELWRFIAEGEACPLKAGFSILLKIQKMKPNWAKHITSAICHPAMPPYGVKEGANVIWMVMTRRTGWALPRLRHQRRRVQVRDKNNVPRSEAEGIRDLQTSGSEKKQIRVVSHLVKTQPVLKKSDSGTVKHHHAKYRKTQWKTPCPYC